MLHLNPKTIRQFNRPKKRKKLEAFNNEQEGSFLHATKGWRRFSMKRSRAAMITEELKKGMFPFNTDKIREALK